MNWRKLLNIYDIAKLAGVSTATVSRVLSGNTNVRPATREKVEKVIRENDYSPSLIARGMNFKSMKTIAIVVLNFTDIHHMLITHEIVRVFNAMDYNTIIYEAGTSVEDVMRFLLRTREMSVDGLVLVGSAFSFLNEENLDKVLSLIGDKPVIVSNGWVRGMYGVLVDEDEGCYDAVEYLVNHGIKKVYYFKSLYTSSSKNKYRGYLKAVDDFALEEHSVFIKEGYLERDVEEAVGTLSIEPGRTAVVCDEDVLAIHVIKFLKEMGKAIPEDISVVGYNNSVYCNLVFPHLSSIDNKASLLGCKCAEFLSEAVTKGTLGEKRILAHVKPEFVSRESTI